MSLDRLGCRLYEIKLAEGDDAQAMAFSGYGSVFNQVDSYGDVIVKGAFRDTLRDAKKSGNWPAMLSQHGGWGMGADDLTPVGIWTDMAEDDHGLKVEGRLADTTRGREAYALLKMQPRPALTGLSIGFVAKEWSIGTKPEEPRRTLKKIELWEVSLVTFPANPKARIADVKSESGRTIRDAEHALREAGFSAGEAKAILAKGFKVLGRRDDASPDMTALTAALKRNLGILAPT